MTWIRVRSTTVVAAGVIVNPQARCIQTGLSFDEFIQARQGRQGTAGPPVLNAKPRWFLFLVILRELRGNQRQLRFYLLLTCDCLIRTPLTKYVPRAVTIDD